MTKHRSPAPLLLTQGFSLPQRGPPGYAPHARGLSNGVLLSLLHPTLYPLPRQFLTKLPVGRGSIAPNTTVSAANAPTSFR